MTDHWADPDEYDAMVKEMRKMQDDLAADEKRSTDLMAALREIAARADEQAGAFAIRADEGGDGHRVAAGRGTDAQHQRHLASIAFMGIARKARAALHDAVSRGSHEG